MIERFDRWLAQNRPAFHASLRPGATDEALDALEAKIGYPLGEAFRALYRWHNGAERSGFPPYSWTSWLSLEEMTAHETANQDSTASDFDADPEIEWHPAWRVLLDDHDSCYTLFDPVGVWGGVPRQVLHWEKADSGSRCFSSLSRWLECRVLLLENAIEDEDGTLWPGDGSLSFVALEWKWAHQHDPGYPAYAHETTQ